MKPSDVQFEDDEGKECAYKTSSEVLKTNQGVEEDWAQSDGMYAAGTLTSPAISCKT